MTNMSITVSFRKVVSDNGYLFYTTSQTSEAFDFYCEYAKFDFSRFDVSWLLNLYPHTLEQIAKNAKVKERVRVAIATTLDGEAIAPSDSQRLQSILVKHFC